MKHHTSKLQTAHIFQELFDYLLQCLQLSDACTNQYVIADIAYTALSTTNEERGEINWVMRTGDIHLVRVASKAYQAQQLQPIDNDAQHETYRFWLCTACTNG